MEIFDNGIPVFGEADDHILNQIRVCARTADKVALMPDNHLGYGVPIGGVVAYRDAISPTGVGFDIGCGNKAVRVDMPGSELRSPDKQSVDMRHFESGGWPLSK
jgi:tRNA-splicing ligase RtcB